MATKKHECIKILFDAVKKQIQKENESKRKDFDLINLRFDKAYNYPHVIPYFEIKYDYTFTKVNGEKSKTAHYSINIIPTYCPFCGKKISEIEKGA